jgi:hypothetical protein
VLTTPESLHQKYALRPRALRLGGREDALDVIEADWGRTAITAEHRSGVNDRVPHVTLRLVGSMLWRAVTRLARNCMDWSPLRDLGSYKGCRLADRDGVYAPGTPNGR